MSVRKIGNQHSLPPNPEWVEFPRTDGDESTWPQATTRIVTGGEVNYYRIVDTDESLSIMWRKTVGPKIAEAMGLPSGKPYVLRSLPDGYRLFDHNKGKADNPRHDPYLYGTPHTCYVPLPWLNRILLLLGSNRIGKNKFRSVNEFIPHAIWLASSDPNATCLCKYCSGKKTQTEISQSFGLSVKRDSASASTPPPRQRRPPPQKPAGPYAAVRRLPRSGKQNAPLTIKLPAPKQTLAQDKSNDVYRALTETDVQRIRYYRKGELVWCAIDPPIAGPRGDEDAIQFWPGLVDMATSKTITSPLADAQSDEADEVDSASQNGEFSPKARITWNVKQHTSYKIKLLAIAQSYTLCDDDILPYLAYAPSENLLENLRNVLPAALSTEKSQELAYKSETTSDYNPLDPSLSAVDRFTEAITPYTLAIQIASNIARFWCPTDEYDCKITFPSSPMLTPIPQTAEGPTPTLQDVLNAASENNASLTPRTHGNSQPTITQTVMQLRYQGLWWGAERIWTDELVRLKLARCQFAPQGAQMVYPAAGPSEKTKEWYIANVMNPDTALAGSSEKGMFMRIEGLFMVDMPRSDGEPGVVKECRASGMIYELVDEEYEDPNEVASQPNGNGKGKERAQEPEAGGSISTSPLVSDPPAPPTPVNGGRSTNLARPVLTTPFPLPDPPEGYKFHAVLPRGSECVLSLSLISGRYYPRLFKHRHLEPIVKEALAVPPEKGGIMLNKHLWAMEGLLPGVHQSMDPELWKDTRYTMLQDADADARKMLGQEIEQLRAAATAAGEAIASASEPLFPMDVAMYEPMQPTAGPSSISAAG
ncbi:hypothetical protein BC835DRAFT_1314941 [Cytidiella melzeri]|nr:hypothetical protein BC835DRAFT_1314941 [Cytidiella melzeri]